MVHSTPLSFGELEDDTPVLLDVETIGYIATSHL
jgi:hypothetical protein